MMPWEHAVVGYVAYSLFVHTVYRDSPTSGETLIVVFGSLLPDLIDKPLAWQFGVFDGGHALAHSIFFAIPLAGAVVALAYSRGRPRFGWAFGIGSLLHLPADVLPYYIGDDELAIHRVLWPIHTRDSSDETLKEGFMENFGSYVRDFLMLEHSLYMQGVVALLGFAVLLWIYDGMPVVKDLYTRLRQIFHPDPAETHSD